MERTAMWLNSQLVEAVPRKCSVKEVFLNISQNPLENACTGFSLITTLQVIS